MAAAQTLARLLHLADQGPAMHGMLAQEVAGLLAGWPGDYPASMRNACEALLAKAARNADATTRAAVYTRLQDDPDLTRRVLGHCIPAGPALVLAARRGALQNALTEHLGIDADTARHMLEDDSGEALAVACKAAGLNRASFSALAILSRPACDATRLQAMLDAFTATPTPHAETLTAA